MKDSNPGKRSPLKQPPLQNPGQSAGRLARDLLDNKVLPWLVLAAFGGAVAMMEWISWLFRLPPAPIVATLIAVGLAGFAWYRVRKTMPLIRQYARGRDGEIAVGQYLEDLRRDGYHVFHDIPSEKGNVDHVLIGPGGVFAIETKTIAKPVGRMSAVVYDGKQVTVDGQVPDRDPVAQVRAASEQIAATIERFLGRRLAVRPVLLYPGWYARQPSRSDIWVMNENTVVKWVRRNYKTLPQEDVQQAAAALDMYVRNYPKT